MARAPKPSFGAWATRLRSRPRARSVRPSDFVPALVVLLLAGHAAALEQTAITGAQNGFGVLRGRGHECFAIVPRHVVEGSARLRVTTVDGVEAPARIEREYTADLAVLRIEPGLACPAGFEVPAELRSLLRPGRRGVVASIGPGGAVESRFVLIERWDDETIEFRPESARDAMRPGLSGALLLLDDRPAGMVIEVDIGNRGGRAHRIDFVAHTVARFFDRGDPSEPVARHPWDGLWVAPDMSVTFRVKVRGPDRVDLLALRPRDTFTCSLLRGGPACLPASEGPESRYGEIRVREGRASVDGLSIAYTETRAEMTPGPWAGPGVAPWPDPGLAPWLAPNPWGGQPAAPGPGRSGQELSAPGRLRTFSLNFRLEARREPPNPFDPFGPPIASAFLVEHDRAWQPLPGGSRAFRLAWLGE